MDLPNRMTRKQFAEFRQKLQSIKTGDFGIAINNNDGLFTSEEMTLFNDVLANESQWLSFFMNSCPYAKYEFAKLIAHYMCDLKEQEFQLEDNVNRINRIKNASTENVE